MSTLKVDTILSAETPTVNFTDGLNVSGIVTATSVTATTYTGITTTALPAGTVLQAVSATTTSVVSNTTTTFADTGLTASITISAGSKVLVMCTQSLDMQRSATACRCAIKLLRGSTDIFAPGNTKNVGIEGTGTDQKILFLPLHFSFLDTGASTGSNTYKLQGRVASASNSARVRFQDDGNPSTITLLEVAG